MGLLDFIVKPAEDVINSIEGNGNKTHTKQKNGAVSNLASKALPAITNVANTVGKAAGSQSILNQPLPGIKVGPTVSQSFDTAVGNNIPGGDILKGQATPESLGATALFAGSLGDIRDNPEEGGNINEAPTGTKGINIGVKGKPNIVPEVKPTTPKILDAKGNPVASNQEAVQTEQPTTNPEINPQQTQTDTQSAQQSSQIPQQKYKTQAMQNRQAYVTQNNTSPSSSDIKANQNRNFGLDSQIKTDQDVQRVNATLNRNGIKGSHVQQKQLQEKTISDLGDKAESQIVQDYNSDPQKYSTSAEDLHNEIYTNVVNNPSFSEIPPQQLHAQIDGYLSRVYARATGNTGITNRSAIPDNIPDTIVYKMKQLMNSDVTSFYDKDPTKLNPDQQIASYARNSLDDIIDAKHPEASGFNSDQADLIKADGQLTKNYNKEVNQANTQAQQPWYKKGKFAAGGAITGAVLGAPFYLNALKNIGFDPSALIGGGVAGIEDMFNKQKDEPSKGDQGQEQYNQQTDNKYYANQAHISSSSIPRTQAEVKPDSYGNWPVANPENIYDSSNNPVIMDRSTYNTLHQQALQKVNNDKALGLTGTPQYAQDLTAQQNLEDRWNNQGTINDNYNKVAGVSSLISKVKSETKGLSNSLLQQTTFDKLSSINNGQYRQLASDITALAKARGIDPNVIWQQQDVSALNGALDSIGQNNAYEWNQYLNQQTGNNGPSNLTNTQIQQPTLNGNTPLPAIKPQGKVQIFNGGGMNAPLPAIPNFQQTGAQFAQ